MMGDDHGDSRCASKTMISEAIAETADASDSFTESLEFVEKQGK